MARKNDTKPSLVVIFVEGDTDEVLFKALIEYYRIVSKTELRPCKICNLRGVTRYTSKLIAKLQNEYLPEARKKGYQTGQLVSSLNLEVIRRKYAKELSELEHALNVYI